MERDAFDILGVPPDADEEAIKRAFRTLARRWHPDVCAEAGAEERFRSIRAAYEALLDPRERARVRAARPASRGGGGGGGGWAGSVFGGEPPGAVLDDLADMLWDTLAHAGRRGGSPWLHEHPGTFEQRFTGRLTDERRIDVDALLTRREAREGITIPFRWQIGPHTLRQDLKVPPGVRSGASLRFLVDVSPGVALTLFVHVEVA